MSKPNIKLGGIEQMVIGMTEEQARRTLQLNSIEARVVRRDGRDMLTTADVPTKPCVYLHIMHGKVVHAE